MRPGTRIRTRVDGPLAPEPVITGRRVPERWTSEYDDPELPVVWRLEMAVRYGRAVCLAVAAVPRDPTEGIDAPELSVPLQDLIDEVTTSALTAPEDLQFSFRPAASWRDLHGAVAHRRVEDNDDYLRTLADVYRAAVEQGEPSVIAVQKRFGLSRSTAGRHVAIARRRGFLGPTRMGVAGEDAEQEDS